MSYERVGLLLPEPSTPPVDASLYALYKKAALPGPETYEVLRLSPRVLEERREVFMESGQRQPVDLQATHIDPDDIRSRRQALVFFRERLAVEIPIGKAPIPNEQGDPILERVLHETLGTDYKLAVSEGVWSVAHGKKELRRPPKYNMPSRRFLGLPGHELMHLVEHINGGRGPLALLQDGLGGYEAGNEGRAVIPEQVAYKNFAKFAKLPRWREFLRRTIAIGHGHGVGEQEARSFTETYALMQRIDHMYQAVKYPTDPKAAEILAHDLTWKLLATRALKGTDGLGGAFLKDSLYLPGNVAAWMVASMHGPEALDQGDLGKYDISNSDHRRLLRHVGLLPAEGQRI